MLAGCTTPELRAIIETFGGNVFVVAADAGTESADRFSVIAANARAARTFAGFDRAPVAPPAADLVPAALRERLEPHFRRCALDRSAVELEEAVIVSAGASCWHFVLVPLTGHDGRVARIMVTATDVTALRTTELRIQNELFDAMFGTTGVAMSLTDEDARFVRVSRSWCELFGYAEDEVLGQPVTLIVAPQERERIAKAYQAGLSGPLPPGTTDCEAVTKTGERITVAVGTSRFLGRDGRIYLAHSVIDVTERRRHEVALAESESWLKQAQRLGHLGYSRTDFKTGVMVWSNELYEIHGLSPDTFVPTHQEWRARVHPDDSCLLDQARERVFQGQGIGQCDYRIIRPSGEVRWIHSEWRVHYDEDGVPATCFSVRQDITERRQREEELLRANLSKTRFLATAGHDLLQPLEAIGMFIGAARRFVADPRGHSALDDLLATKQSMRRLLRSLLDFASIETGNISAHPRRVALGPILRQICEEHVRFAEAKGISLRWVGTTLAVRTDPALFERILRNLVGNAVRYTETGRVVVGCRRLPNGRVRVEVHDTGPGIDKHDLSRIFQEFEQIPRRDSDRSSGVGLGLTIADHLARMLGHAVTVRSTLGQGSVFAVMIARSEPDQPDQPAPKELARFMANFA